MYTTTPDKIEKDERVVYSIVRYESPLILTKEMEVA